MPAGELVAAGVADQRVFDVYGESSPNGLYLLGLPGRALPFSIHRAWKVPTGYVSEEVRLVGPSGRTIWRWGPEARFMRGSMDLTVEIDRVEDAVFDELGTYIASFILESEIIGEVEVPIHVQAAPAKLPKEIEEGLKKSDVIWLGIPDETSRWYRPTAAPSWFAYRNGRIYVLSRNQPGPDEQSIPGLPEVEELTVTTRHKGRDTSLDSFPAAVRLLDGPEWEEAAKALADKRKSRHGSPAESIQRWRGSCAIAELVPVVDA